MEKYIVKKLDKDDNDSFNEFIFEHVVNDEEQLVCDNSLITDKPYIKYYSFNNWYEVNKLIGEYKYMHERVKAFTYLVYRNVDERLRLVSVFEIRVNLTPKTEKYGNISINVRPSERNKGYYSKSLRYALSLTKELNLDKVTLVISQDDLRSKKAIENNFTDMEINAREDKYVYTFYNQKVNEHIDDDYFNSDHDSFIYVCSTTLFNDKVNKGMVGYSDLNDSLTDCFEHNVPFCYIYVLDAKQFSEKKTSGNVLDNDTEPYEIIKVTYDEYEEIINKKKLIK